MTETKSYQAINSDFFDRWVAAGWEWGIAASHEAFVRAQDGDWSVLLTPTRPVPKDWFCPFQGAKILGLAPGGGQQMPIFTALGADCTVMDLSASQLDAEQKVAQREHYSIKTVQSDMTKPFPFPDESFDLIFHPVSNCYVEDVEPVWRDCHRVLKRGGLLLSGLDNGVSYAFNDAETSLKYQLPFNPLKNSGLYEDSLRNDWGIQFSHTLEEQIGGQLKAGFVLQDIYQDTSGMGRLHEYNVPTFFATKAIKP